MNLVFGFSSKNIEDAGLRYFYAQENNTLLDRSKFVWTHDDLAKLKDFSNKTDVIESCSRERMNTKCGFYRLTNLTLFAALLKDVPMGARTQSYPNLCSKITQSTVSRLKRTRENHITTTCVFFVLLLSICTVLNDWKKRLQNWFNFFFNKMDGMNADQCHGVHTNDIIFVEDLLTLNIVLYDIDIVDCIIVGELARRRKQKHNNTVRLLKYNNRICYVSNVIAVFHASRCPNCDIFFSRAFNLERPLTTCSERVNIICQRNVYQIRQTLFDKLVSFGIKYTSERKLFNKLSNIRFWINL